MNTDLKDQIREFASALEAVLPDIEVNDMRDMTIVTEEESDQAKPAESKDGQTVPATASRRLQTVEPTRRSRIRGPMVAFGAAVLVLVLAIVPLLLTGSGSGGEIAAESSVPVNTGVRITSEMILEDGVVTDEEYRAGALAVVACLTDAGFEAGVDFDDPSGNPTSLEGHAGFAVDHADNATESANEAFNRCQDLHLSDNVSLGWAALLGQINLEELREETATLVACVEGRTGVDFGELTYDKFGFLTDQGEQTRDAAFEYRVHSFWGECRAEIGLLSWPDPDSFRMHEDLEPTDSGFLEIVERDGLTLMILGPLDNVCLEVTDETGMAGGCGADLAEPMNFGVGGLRGKSFIYGWAPTNAAKVVVTLADATEIEVTELVIIEGFDVQFFLEIIPSNETGEADLPIKAVAVDADGDELAGFLLGE